MAWKRARCWCKLQSMRERKCTLEAQRIESRKRIDRIDRNIARSLKTWQFVCSDLSSQWYDPSALERHQMTQGIPTSRSFLHSVRQTDVRSRFDCICDSFASDTKQLIGHNTRTTADRSCFLGRIWLLRDIDMRRSPQKTCENWHRICLHMSWERSLHTLSSIRFREGAR